MDIEHRRKRMRLVLSDDSDDEADDDKDEQINLSNDEDSKEVIAQKK